MARPHVKSALAQEMSEFYTLKGIPLARKALEDLLGAATPAGARFNAAKFVVQAALASEAEATQREEEVFELSAAEMAARIEAYELERARAEAIDIEPLGGIFD